jgi:alkyl hydroperoxide reductase subunit AhpF
MDRLLDDSIRAQVVDFFGDLEHPVQVLFFGSDDPTQCTYCQETRQLLEEITGLSEKLSLETYDLRENADLASLYKVDAAPSFVIAGLEDEKLVDYGIRYKGIPSGHEFTSLVNSVMIVSKRDSGLSQDTREYLKTLSQPVYLQVFTTPT